MDLRSSGSTFSWSVVVFSANEMCNASAIVRETAGTGKSLTLNSTILDTEKLSLVVSRDCGVRVNVAWQHRQFLGQIVHLHVLFLCSF